MSRGMGLGMMAALLAGDGAPTDAVTLKAPEPTITLPKSALGSGSGGNKYYESRADKNRRRKLALVSKRINRRRSR